MPAKLDQHFLADDAVADLIVREARISEGEDVLEIGPGGGVLTGRLLAAGARLTAVEFDSRLVGSLRREYGEKGLTVIHSDWLKIDLDALPRPTKIVSNLPYSVATPILQRLLDWPAWDRAILMFQKEVGHRILAQPDTKPYGILSLSVRIKADAYLLCDVPASSFNPPPKVDSAVLCFERLKTTRLPQDVSETDFFKTVKTAFSQKRKMAAKLLSAGFHKERREIEKIFEDCGLRKDARAEIVDLKTFIEITRRLRLLK